MPGESFSANRNWPLRCVYCRKEFATVSHDNCTGFESKEMPKTLPLQSEQDFAEVPVHNPDFLSPPSITGPIRCDDLVSEKEMFTATSTPTNNRKDEKGFVTVSKFITPVAYVLKKNAIEHKSTCEDRLPDKDRVTFTEGSEEIVEKGKICQHYIISPPLKKSDNASPSCKSVVLKSKNKQNIGVTFWESAPLDNSESPKENRECNITICNNIKQEVVVINSNNYFGAERPGKFLSFVAESVRSVVQAFFRSPNDNFDFRRTNTSVKRPKIEDADDAVCPKLKKMKLTELKCRRSIHDYCSLRICPRKPHYVDKWTQTD